MKHIVITYDKNIFAFDTQREAYKAMDRMDFGNFEMHFAENSSEAIKQYTLSVERDLTTDEIINIKQLFIK